MNMNIKGIKQALWYGICECITILSIVLFTYATPLISYQLSFYNRLGMSMIVKYLPILVFVCSKASE